MAQTGMGRRHAAPLRRLALASAQRFSGNDRAGPLHRITARKMLTMSTQTRKIPPFQAPTLAIPRPATSPPKLSTHTAATLKDYRSASEKMAFSGKGKIVLVRYFEPLQAIAGFKALTAERGKAPLPCLIYSDPAEDGPHAAKFFPMVRGVRKSHIQAGRESLTTILYPAIPPRPAGLCRRRKKHIAPGKKRVRFRKFVDSAFVARTPSRFSETWNGPEAPKIGRGLAHHILVYSAR